ncbi:hypothetical protein B0T10DRAFT_464201 [Thelonectria olida]|uniref:Uncharacterized protein n=1 Tax=Thelonectria olida TaxID=1576542 RepID=A0A9P8VVM4_9HYPO|nr:hypothetical protein B0T10DRAFT_464201 [Thelonectria olida]
MRFSPNEAQIKVRRVAVSQHQQRQRRSAKLQPHHAVRQDRYRPIQRNSSLPSLCLVLVLPLRIKDSSRRKDYLNSVTVIPIITILLLLLLKDLSLLSPCPISTRSNQGAPPHSSLLHPNQPPVTSQAQPSSLPQP